MHTDEHSRFPPQPVRKLLQLSRGKIMLIGTRVMTVELVKTEKIRDLFWVRADKVYWIIRCWVWENEESSLIKAKTDELLKFRHSYTGASWEDSICLSSFLCDSYLWPEKKVLFKNTRGTEAGNVKMVALPRPWSSSERWMKGLFPQRALETETYTVFKNSSNSKMCNGKFGHFLL